jgi:diaminopimelate decarboxylase
MNEFAYRNGELFAEGVALRAMAEQHGTPLYVYSRNHLRSQYRALAAAMAEVQPLICYSIKANSNGAVIRTFAEEGAGFDIVSGGELYRALRAGADPRKIVFAGVGKTRAEIEYALRERILFFTVESEAEAARISECAKRMGGTGRIAFRVNPDVDPKTHKYISTGKKENKFGLDIERTATAYATAAALPNIEIAGLHMHIGSQILSAQPFADAIAKVRDLCGQLRQTYATFRYLDIGGGIGISYKPEQSPLAPAVYAEKVVPLLKGLGLALVLEPGRNLVGNAGVLLCRVQYIKTSAAKKFVIVDAAMNDLIRPSLYDAHHEVLPVAETSGTMHGDVVGPVCESGDFIALDRALPQVREGDLLAIMSAGAYGFAMASNYNSRPRPAEVMADGGKATVVRERETWEDLVKGERI